MPEEFDFNNLIKNWFSIKFLNIPPIKIKYYSIEDNYKLDEFCELYYEKFKRNPYFINKWYSTESFYKFLMKELCAEPDISDKIFLELGSGLGITPVFLKSYLKKIISIDYEYTSCLIGAATSKLNNCEKVRHICADWSYPPFKTKFDIIIASDIIYEISSVNQVLKCIDEFLKINGILYIANFKNYAFDEFRKRTEPKFKMLFCQKKTSHTQKIQIYKFVKKFN